MWGGPGPGQRPRLAPGRPSAGATAFPRISGEADLSSVLLAANTLM